jgi:hypothetical protein
MISQTEEYLVQLRSLVGTNEKLKKHGYVTQYLTVEELLLKQRCLGCGKSKYRLMVELSLRANTAKQCLSSGQKGRRF